MAIKNLTIDQFENLNLYSNRNMEKIIGSLVNNSSNAVLVNMGEDSLILLDHKKGQFYIADYKFEPKTLKLTIENFDEIQLTRDEDSFEESVYDYFDSDEGDVLKLTESYKHYILSQDKFINELVNESMGKKNFDNLIDYDSIHEVLESEELESANESFFKKYKERLISHPLNEIKYFDWKNQVNVSLIETENTKLINKSAIQKAHDLWKKTSFKESFFEAVEVFIEDVEEGNVKLQEVFENFPQVFFLDEADRRTLFGKALLSNSNLREDMNDILKGLDLMFEKFDLGEMRNEYLSEAELEDEEPNAAATSDDASDDKDEEKPEELDASETEKIIADLKKIAEKATDEDTKKKLDDLIEKLNKGVEEGTRPEIVKEAVSILSL